MTSENRTSASTPRLLRASRAATFAFLFGLALLGLASPARAAEVQSDAKNRFSVDLGFQAGFAGHAPAGGKVILGYQRLLKGQMWLDLQVDLVMGRRWGDRGCYYSTYLDAPVCDAWNWHGLGADVAAGLAWRFRVGRAPKLVPFAKANLVLGALSFPRSPGFALAVKGTGGVRYYVKPTLGLGLQVGFALGLGYLDPGGTALYAAFDLGFGLEFAF
jgi:hypothetical protein